MFLPQISYCKVFRSISQEPLQNSNIKNSSIVLKSFLKSNQVGDIGSFQSLYILLGSILRNNFSRRLVKLIVLKLLYRMSQIYVRTIENCAQTHFLESGNTLVTVDFRLISIVHYLGKFRYLLVYHKVHILVRSFFGYL